MDIFYILPKYDYFSSGYRGRVTHALGVANGLAENKNNVTVFSNHDIKSFREDFDSKILLVSPKHRKYFISFIRNILWPIKLLSLVKLNFNSKPPKLVICRYVVRNIIFNYILTYSINKQSKSVVEVNSLAYHQYNNLSYPIRKLIIWLEIKQLHRFNVVYVVSQKIKEDLLNNNCKNKVIVVPNAFGGLISKLRTEKTDYKIVRLIFFGKFQPYYDYQILIKTYKNLKAQFENIELHFWGDGSAFSETIIMADNFDGIHFHGQYKRGDLNNIFRLKTDILLLPLLVSKHGEIVSPIKMFEYMSFGLPIIASKVGQIQEIFEDRKNGFFYNPNQMNSLFNTIKFCLKNQKKRILVGQNAKKDLFNHHTWSIRMKEMTDLISKN